VRDGVTQATRSLAALAARCVAGPGGFLRQRRNRAALLGTLALVATVAVATLAFVRPAPPPAVAGQRAAQQAAQQAAVQPAAPPAILPPPTATPDGLPPPAPRHAEEPGLGPQEPALAPPADAFELPPPPAPPAPPAPAVVILPPNAGTPPEPAAAAALPPAEVGEPAWRRHAVPVVLEPGRAVIAIVIDDLGPGHGAALKAIALPGPLTLAFLPYADNLASLTAKARAAGHELLVHLPWEPIDLTHNYPGPQALLTDLPLPEVQARLDWALGRFEGYVGINNHMGSAFSTWDPGLAVVMQELRAKGLLFLDSRTVGNSKAEGMALAYGVPAAGRDVFLDNTAHDPTAV